MRDSRRTPEGQPLRQSYRLLSHVNRDKLDIFRIEKLWKNEKWVFLYLKCRNESLPTRFQLLASFKTLKSKTCPIVLGAGEKKSVLVISNSSGGRGSPSATTTSGLTRRTTPRRGASTRMNYSACRCMRSSRWRRWWERAAFLTSTRTAKVRRGGAGGGCGGPISFLHSNGMMPLCQ